MKREEALDAVRVLVANGAQFDTNVPTSTVITWLDHAGYDEEACLRSLGYAAALGWISGGAHFDFILRNFCFERCDARIQFRIIAK